MDETAAMPLPEPTTLEPSASEADAVVLGAVGGPAKWDDPDAKRASLNRACSDIRKELKRVRQPAPGAPALPSPGRHISPLKEERIGQRGFHGVRARTDRRDPISATSRSGDDFAIRFSARYDARGDRAHRGLPGRRHSRPGASVTAS